MSSKDALTIKKKRSAVAGNTIRINIHEWGGYPLKRSKKVNVIPEFECGLYYQLERFTKDDGLDKNVSVTISEITRHQHLEYIKSKVENVFSVSNDGMDFSGYNFFYESIKDLPNSYVILTNSSVNKIQTEFLKDYIKYMDDNLDVGILGVSYSSKKMQTLIRNNFTPHLQSFFLLTTTEVLKEIVEKNNGIFPGSTISHKLSLILKGEVKISEIAILLGYNLAVTLENKSIFKFGKNNWFDNGYKRWKLKEGDVRLTVKNPNIINEIII
ncbi:hypothetical protein J2787_003070 [Chryseobacterium rhizosphaerae]|uniref:Uncharacterized protein n=1 Tax=Chryseobacterium rhizosphaerae TaxID=395937 RepID=A0AAE3YCK7_9FLAO|nr:hypothetical protein [Chryseobacterium rhizosphaerae]MDR6527678.1 hypothetical protein [Chryseobacterium rhizosphaerae]